MFKKMMKQELAWNDFTLWFYNNLFHLYIKNSLNSLTEKEAIIVLSIMPFYFDKKGIYIINTERYSRVEHGARVYDFLEEDRKESLIKACEKSFEIYNKRLEK